MIERRRCPGGGGVALLTSLREAGLHVVGLRRALEILHVATHAGRVRAVQCVVAVHVALVALHARMGAGQRESRRVVVKGRVVPRGRGMALLTGLREAGLHVVRIGRAVEVLDVAGCAIRRCSHKLAVDVALGTANINVSARQRKLRECIVIESRRIPCAAVVARLAGRREPSLRMRRVVRLIEVRHVASHACGRRADKLPSRVAGIAVQSRVRSHQREAGKLQVIELCPHPVIHRVALFAGRRQVQCDVVNSC